MKEPIGVTFQKIINTLFKKKKKNTIQRDPYGDWQKMVIISIIAFIIVAIVDGYIFYKLNRGELFTTTSTDTVQAPVPFNKTLLQEDNKFYDAKEAKLNEL